MELHAVEPSLGILEAAIGAAGEPAVTRAPAGGAVTESRWLIQPVCSAPRPAKSALSGSARTSVLPNSETPVRLDRPAELLRHQLHAVTDPERGHAQLEEAGSTRGAPAAYTDAGPPESTNARGLLARASAAEIECGTSSE